jgi:molybdenum cofactor biosynthesis protein B
MGVKEHKKGAPKSCKIAVVTVSSSRVLKNDDSGNWIKKRSEKEGHRVVFHRVIPDDKRRIVAAVTEALEVSGAQAILVTGGTGISRQDVTIEAISPLFDKELTAFGALFTALSFEQIDSAAIMSRATAGIVKGAVVFCMPGSLKACKLACTQLIFPELGHILKHSVTS